MGDQINGMDEPDLYEIGWPRQQPTLRNDGLTLRPWRFDDAGAVLVACQDPDIQRFTTVPVPYLAEHAEGFVTDRASGSWARREGVAFCLAGGDDEVLGACGIVAVDHQRLVGEVGYWVGPAGRGRGVAARALRLLADWAFGQIGLARLELYIEPENTASIKVAARAGCEREGLLRRKAIVRGERRDMLLYALLP